MRTKMCRVCVPPLDCALAGEAVSTNAAAAIDAMGSDRIFPPSMTAAL
jgi:hypothetical protein